MILYLLLNCSQMIRHLHSTQVSAWFQLCCVLVVKLPLVNCTSSVGSLLNYITLQRNTHFLGNSAIRLYYIIKQKYISKYFTFSNIFIQTFQHFCKNLILKYWGYSLSFHFASYFYFSIYFLIMETSVVCLVLCTKLQLISFTPSNDNKFKFTTFSIK